ncbi:hypothetical protein DL89DRAFT_180994 [Linderina pennispora]|uniref:Uncharacterized protein n=1 Tax=Linderina pennispora TaxID=61395 RepID=A0A1Y1W531_9FUNG|nr:uncharacterized protein DL89DRAFT_180994 [Linderina pennispora]ORX68620.1 hypothetical protein DL89DRAFT_180994 [Linderina pennispora]
MHAKTKVPLPHLVLLLPALSCHVFVYFYRYFHTMYTYTFGASHHERTCISMICRSHPSKLRVASRASAAQVMPW